MKSEKGVFVITLFLMAAVMFFSFLLRNAEAGPRGGGAVVGPRGGGAVEGSRGGGVAEGSRGNVAIGTRFNVLPAAVKIQIINDRTYYVDGSGVYYVYYLPCDDDETVYCVVPPPE